MESIESTESKNSNINIKTNKHSEDNCNCTCKSCSCKSCSCKCHSKYINKFVYPEINWSTKEGMQELIDRMCR
jgi:hypothetical protein